MKPWLKWSLVIVGALVLLYGALVAFASYSNGTNVTATLHLGENATSHEMYLRCDAAASSRNVCSGDEQAIVTVHARDRVKFVLINDDGGDHTHDFKLLGWEYSFPPVSPESELHSATESWTFTAWSSGTYRLICEIPGHDKAGMHGTFKVL